MVKVSYPAMGWRKIAFRSLLQFIPGVEVLYPPEVNSEIIKMGAKHAPEFVCYPMKVVLGEIHQYD